MLADKIGNYKVVLMGSILATGAFHTLLLTIDAHGVDPATIVTNNNLSSATELVYLTCDNSGRTFLELPNNCADSTCSYSGNLSMFDRSANMIRLMPSECTQSCNGTKSTGLCLATDNTADCHSLGEEGVLLQLGLGNTSLPTSSSDFCSFPVNQLFLSNSSQVAVLHCGCPIQCPALMTIQTAWRSCLTTNETLPSKDDYDHVKHRRGFWLYLIIRILATAALGTSFTMLDATTICLIKKYKGHFGRQRLFGVLGSAAFAMPIGILLDWASSLNNGKVFCICHVNKI